MRAVAHPLRLRLVELFADGPRTTKQAALALGLPPTRLYHHVHALERAGLLRLRETRRKRGTEERYYETAETLLKGRPLTGAREAGVEPTAVALSVIEAARLEVAMLRGPRRGGERGLIARLRISSPETGKRLKRDLRALLRRLQPAEEGDSSAQPRRASAGAAWSLTLLLLPVDEK
jgi:DNA-binding transcriptional ArsR family regulator